MPPFGNFTTKARDAIRRAHELAIERGQNHVNSLHLLTALVVQEESIVLSLLEKLEVDTAVLTDTLTEAIESPEGSNVLSPSYQIYLTPELAQVLEYSAKVAREMHDEFVSTEHLFVALLDVSGPAKETLARFSKLLSTVPNTRQHSLRLSLVVDTLKPTIKTEETNILGIEERIGRGYSEFAHSIAGRIHNVVLTAAKINGILVKPGETFSFNNAIGDISEATGFQPAYIIKDGRTVLGDGGGVCQVSTTLFRAVLAAGLPVLMRQAHAYRVAYYEQAGYKAGLDATVFAPSVDFVFKNDTPGYILIQTTTNRRNLTLTIDIYGTNDGRKAEILNHVVGGITPPPPDLYQDDPTLPTGTVKQVDFAAWGAKTSFQYKVTKNGDTLQNQTFYSNFRPWQAVFLRGTATQ